MAAGFAARLTLAEAVVELQRIGGELTPAVKKQFVPKDLERVRRVYAERMAKLKPAKTNGGADGQAGSAHFQTEAVTGSS